MSKPPDDDVYGLDEIVSNVHTELRHANNDIAPRDARLLMAQALGVDVARISLMARNGLTRRTKEEFWAFVGRRNAGAPVSHIIGKRAFYGREFKVTSDVLDPRPETETLIEAALQVSFTQVLDLGTGSGCILVTLLAERSNAIGIGLDVSERALAVADNNAQVLGVHDRCAFVLSDWFSAVGDTYDLIVSNPPYIAADEMAGLSPELAYEPRMALTDESDGLACYRIITAGAAEYLTPQGSLMVEIGPTQGAAVVAMFEAEGFVQVEIRSDLDGRDRVVLGRKPL